VTNSDYQGSVPQEFCVWQVHKGNEAPCRCTQQAARRTVLLFRLLLRTVFSTKKLNGLLQDGSVRHCITLINAILVGIDQHFRQYCDEGEFIIAGVLIPQFRPRFLPSNKKQLTKQLVLNALNDLPAQNNDEMSEQA
jgi:hypothetical protein